MSTGNAPPPQAGPQGRPPTARLDAIPEAYDAVLVPSTYKGISSIKALVRRLTKDFGPALGMDPSDPTRHVHCRHDGKGRLFVVGNQSGPHCFAHFGKGHPTLPGEPRYEWYDRGDNVWVGVLTDAARAELENPAEEDA